MGVISGYQPDMLTQKVIIHLRALSRHQEALGHPSFASYRTSATPHKPADKSGRLQDAPSLLIGKCIVQV